MRSRKLPTSGVYTPVVQMLKGDEGSDKRQQQESALVCDTSRLPTSSRFTPVPSVSGERGGCTRTEPDRLAGYVSEEMGIGTVGESGVGEVNGGSSCPLVSEEMLVHKDYVGSVIGRKGANINRIKEANCAALSFVNDQMTNDGLVPLLIRAPTIEHAQRARQQVEEILARCETFASRRGSHPPLAMMQPPPQSSSLAASSQPRHAMLMAEETSAFKYTPVESSAYATPGFDHHRQPPVLLSSGGEQVLGVGSGPIRDARLQKLNSDFNGNVRVLESVDYQQQLSRIDGSHHRVGVEGEVVEELTVHEPLPGRTGGSSGISCGPGVVVESIPVRVEQPNHAQYISLYAFKETVEALAATINGLQAANLALQQKLDCLQSAHHHPEH